MRRQIRFACTKLESPSELRTALSRLEPDLRRLLQAPMDAQAHQRLMPEPTVSVGRSRPCAFSVRHLLSHSSPHSPPLGRFQEAKTLSSSRIQTLNLAGEDCVGV